MGSLTRWQTCVAIGLVLLLCGAPAAAQSPVTPPSITVPPFNVMLPNYNSVAVGEIGSLEANAFVARADDSSAAWYNPAGLTLATKSSVSGSAGMFQFATVSPEGLNNRGGSFQQIPSMVGLVVKDLLGNSSWAGGLSLARVNAWAQSVDGERNFTGVNTTDRIMYSGSANMSGWMADVGVGHRHSDKLRFGATLDLQLTSTERSATLSEQYRTSPGLTALLIDSHGTSSTVHMRASVGAQYDLSPAVRLGAVIRTRGLRLYQSGSYVYEGVSKSGVTTTTASLFAPSGDVEYRVPFEIKVGAAYIRPRGRVEVNLLTWTGAGTYQAFHGAPSWTILTEPDSGSPTLVEVPPFVSPVVDANAVVNIAIGGQARITESGSWMVHAGFATDRSPVGPDDTYFTKIHMQTVTAGVSGRASFLLASLGIRYEAGTSGDLLLRQLENGQQLTTKMKVSTVGLVYSVALLF